MYHRSVCEMALIDQILFFACVSHGTELIGLPHTHMQ